MLFVVHGDMAAELIVGVNAEKENIGLTTWKNLPYRIIVNPDMTVVKNNLKAAELTGIWCSIRYGRKMSKRYMPKIMEA